LLDQYFLRIAQQCALKKGQGKVFLEAMNERHIRVLVRITWHAPFIVFGEATIDKNISQRLQLIVPLGGAAKEIIDLWIHRININETFYENSKLESPFLEN